VKELVGLIDWMVKYGEGDVVIGRGKTLGGAVACVGSFPHMRGGRVESRCEKGEWCIGVLKADQGACFGFEERDEHWPALLYISLALSFSRRLSRLMTST